MSTTNDTAEELTLQFTNPAITPTSLVSLISDYFSEAQIGDSTPTDLALVQTSQKKKFSFFSTPLVLVVHLSRFVFDAGRAWKNSLAVEFTEKLTLHAADGVYDLLAVAIHSGTGSNEGHYWAFVKRAGSWKKYNDIHVTAVDFKTVLKEGIGGKGSPTAYVLFYRLAKK